MSGYIYLDHAATTRPGREVVCEMLPYLDAMYGNPSSSYDFAILSEKAVNKSRRIILETLGNPKGNIYFTSGGTESDNWAVSQVINKEKKHIITSCIEHHAILNACKKLEQEGVKITYIPVDNKGVVDVDSIKKAIQHDTALISIMTANNEIGTIEPLYEIGQIAKEHNVLFHTDAVQAYGHIPIDVDEMNIDLLSASGHKFNGPKGVGFLFIREGISIDEFIRGGSQEYGKRAGTENVPGIVGMGKAAEIAHIQLHNRIEREIYLRDYFLGRLCAEIPGVRINGSINNRLPNNINITIFGANADALLVLLDMDGICASSGSACSSRDDKKSHVLSAIGLNDEDARNTLRFTLGYENTKSEIDYTVERLKLIVSNQRS